MSIENPEDSDMEGGDNTCDIELIPTGNDKASDVEIENGDNNANDVGTGKSLTRTHIWLLVGCGCVVVLALMATLIALLTDDDNQSVMNGTDDEFVYDTYVECDEYAFKKSTKTNQVNLTKVYEGGPIIYGPNQVNLTEFCCIRGYYLWANNNTNYTKVVFPKLLQMQGLNLSVANIEGVSMNIAVLFQYQLSKNNLSSIYSYYGSNYKTQLYSLSRAAVRNTVVGFSVNQLMENRSFVHDQIINEVSRALAEVFIDGPVYLEHEIGFPEPLISAHLNAAVQLEFNLQKNYEQQAWAIRYQTNVTLREYAINTTNITSAAEANATATIVAGQIKYEEIIDCANREGLNQTMTTLGIVNETERIRFVELMSILDNVTYTP